MELPSDYVERVYAGVLGKLIGVYLGRPFEGWSYAEISARLGEVDYYVHERRDLPLHNHRLIVTDDDITGTFTFPRALADYGHTPDLTPAQIGQTWLNYIVEGRTILWWGGRGNSTEHTAYLNLKAGITAPASGSAARNGPIVAEQIGAQIFVDGWAMLCPGDPERAADLARRAASVSHDGAAVHAAQALAAMEALAFVEPRLDVLLDTATALLPPDALIRRLIDDMRAWAARDGDWRLTRERIERHYGYERYGGNCHVVPNHALILLGLLYGGDDLQRALRITNTAGWDTDCNSGNLGCLLGIKHGLAGLERGPDWRGPVADQLFLPTADGGRAISDAVRESYALANMGRALRHLPPLAPKGGARFHFELPGAVQAFRPADADLLALENVAGHSERGSRSLALRYRGVAAGRTARAATPTFIPPEARDMPGYELLASPTLYAGQSVWARVSADPGDAQPVRCGLYVQLYGADDRLTRIDGPEVVLAPGASHSLSWRLPLTYGAPLAEVGVAIGADARVSGTIYLDELSWDGTPELTLTRPVAGGMMWRRAWVNGVDQWGDGWPEPFRLVQNTGTGLLIHGAREWTDYSVHAAITLHMAAAAGIAARVQGMRRAYALLLVPGMVRLVKLLDGAATLAEAPFAWSFGETHNLRLDVTGATITAYLNGRQLWTVVDTARPLESGGIALVVEEGCLSSEAVRVEPIDGGPAA